MATKPRIIAPDVFYQISSEGVKDLNMFKTDGLKSFFFEQLAKSLKKYSITLYAFALTINHYYIVVKTSKQSVSKAMQHFNSVIAKNTNKVLNRGGTVFAYRFKSVIIEEEIIKEVIKYVHLKPLEHKTCSLDNFDTFKWCSHSIFKGNNSSKMIDLDSVLKLFGENPEADYENYMKDLNNIHQTTKILNDVNNGKQGFYKPQLWIIGKPDFVKFIMDQDKCRRLRLASHIIEDVYMDKIHDEVTRLLLLDKDSLFKTGKLNIISTARELFAALCKHRYEFSGAQTARYLKTTDSAVSKMLLRFINIDNGNYLIKRVVEEITTS